MSLSLQCETLTHCPACGAAGLQYLLTASDGESGSGDYGIELCRNCGVAVTNPRPLEAELPRLYEQRDSTDFLALSTGLAPRLRDRSIDQYLQRQLRGIYRNGNAVPALLDFGCGDGALVRGMLRHARRHARTVAVTAVDFHPTAPLALSGLPGVRYSTHAQLQGDATRYDVVFLRHVLEHHPHPLQLLSQLRRLLRPGGWLVVEVPNRRSVWATLCGRHYSAYYVPRHLLHFDHDSLHDLFVRDGWSGVSIAAGHTPILGNSLGSALGRRIGNTGLLGLLSFPLQVALDAVLRRSTTLRLRARRD